jgi:hypothetical protein
MAGHSTGWIASGLDDAKCPACSLPLDAEGRCTSMEARFGFGSGSVSPASRIIAHGDATVTVCADGSLLITGASGLWITAYTKKP